MKITVVVAGLMCLASIGFAQTKTTGDVPKDQEVKKLIEQIAGSWKLQRIVDEEKNNKSTANSPDKQPNEPKQTPTGMATSDQTNNAMQVVEFNPNGRYKLNSSTTSLDSGSFRINENHGLLYLESDADDVSPTEWAVTLKNNQLTLVGRGQKSVSRYKYIYTKEKEKLGTN
jgi:hypothetical protein